MKANIPPFYVGQKVVYITGKNMPKDSIHTVRGLEQFKCGCWMLDIGKTKPTVQRYACLKCGGDAISGVVEPYTHYYQATSFRALEEINMPPLTFEEIKEVEKEEVLTLN